MSLAPRADFGRPDLHALRLCWSLRAAGVGGHAQDATECQEPVCVAARKAVLAWYAKRPKG